MAGVRKRSIILPFLLTSMVLAAAGQGSTQVRQIHAGVRGTVRDSTGAAIPGARITVFGSAPSPRPTAASDQNGEFSLSLEPGSYTLVVERDGFSEVKRAVNIGASDSESLEFTLQVAGTHETVTVAESPGYEGLAVSAATKTLTVLRDVPQSITVVTRELMADQMMMSIGDVVRYVPGITAIQGENNRDQIVIRGNSSSADFFLDGVRDDVQYYRDLYNLERVEALKGPNAMIFGRGGGGGVINRVTKEPGFAPLLEFTALGGSYGARRFTADFDRPLNDRAAFRFNGLYDRSGSFRDHVDRNRFAANPTLKLAPGRKTSIILGYEHFRDNRVADRGIPSFQGRPADIPISEYFGDPKESYANARVNLGSAVIDHQVGRLNIRNRLLIGNYDRGYQNFVPGAITADRRQAALSAYNNATVGETLSTKPI